MLRQEWIMKRNCSIAPYQLGQVFAILCAASLTVALAFTLRGAWYILCFAVLELSVVGFAFLIYARHATDREYIALVDDYLLVEFVCAEKIRRFRLNVATLRIHHTASHRNLIRLESSGMRVEVGQYLTQWKRREFAQELERALLTNSTANAAGAAGAASAKA